MGEVKGKSKGNASCRDKRLKKKQKKKNNEPKKKCQKSTIWKRNKTKRWET